MHAAVNADCLAAQNEGAYWAFTDYVHAHGDEVSGQDRDPEKSFAALDRIARQQATLAHLDSTKLSACLTAQDETAVRKSLKEGAELGIDGAPALFINGERLNGALPEKYIWMAIDRALRSVGIEPPPLPDADKSAPKASPKPAN